MNEEQITKIESEEPFPSQSTPKTKKQKDPKKVAAGKALARKNAEARKILKQDEMSSSQEESSPLLEISKIYNGIQSIAGIVGTGFTLYHGWNFYKSYRKPTPLHPPAIQSPTPEPSHAKKSIRKSTEF